MADKLTLHGATSITRHTGTDIRRVNPKRGGSLHSVAQWWNRNPRNIVYVDCLVLLVTRADGDLKIAIPITDSSRLTISYDGSDDFTFTGFLNVDRIGVFDASDFSFCEEYVLPHIVGGKQMKRKVNPLPAPSALIGPVTINATGITDGTISADIDDIIDLSAVVAGATATDLVYLWSVDGSTVTIVGPKSKADAQLRCQGAGSVNVTCTVSSATASDSPAEAAVTVVVSAPAKAVSNSKN